MSLTYWNVEKSGGVGNFTPDSLYYEEDRQIVLSQAGKNGAKATSSGLINYNFRGEPITVFAATDAAGNVLPLVGLPCPPYYRRTMAEALPGNILTD